MRLALDTRSALVRQLPELQLSHLGRKHKQERQDFLVYLLNASYERRRPHETDSTADSFSSRFLLDGLRCSPNGSGYKNRLRPFYQFTEANGGYDKNRKLTKPYRLRPHVVEVLDRVYSGDEALPVVRADTGERVDRLPATGLPAPLGDFGCVPSVIPLDPHRLSAAIDRCREWIDTGGEWLEPNFFGSSVCLPEVVRCLRVARKYAVSIGGIPNFYQPQSQGRLGPVGYHVITLSRFVRRLMFEGSGLADFDIASCFPSIFVCLGKANQFPTDHTEDYLRNKLEWHTRWAKRARHWDANAFKAIVASFFTGGTLSSHSKTASARAVGCDTMTLLGEEQDARALLAEIQRGMRRVIDAADRSRDGKQTAFVNAVGAPLEVTRTRADFGRLCCHLITGYEQFAIREMIGRASNVQAVIYDGFIASPQSTQQLEEHIRTTSSRSLGVTLDLRLKTEDISERMPSPQKDDFEF